MLRQPSGNPRLPNHADAQAARASQHLGLINPSGPCQDNGFQTAASRTPAYYAPGSFQSLNQPLGRAQPLALRSSRISPRSYPVMF